MHGCYSINVFIYTKGNRIHVKTPMIVMSKFIAMCAIFMLKVCELFSSFFLIYSLAYILFLFSLQNGRGVYYSVVTSGDLLTKYTNDPIPNFTPQWVLVVTWNKVQYSAQYPLQVILYKHVYIYIYIA